MLGDFIACCNNNGTGPVSVQPVQKANAPTAAALMAAKRARLPEHVEAELARVGVPAPRQQRRKPEPRPMWTGPTEDQPECPF